MKGKNMSAVSAIYKAQIARGEQPTLASLSQGLIDAKKAKLVGKKKLFKATRKEGRSVRKKLLGN